MAIGADGPIPVSVILANRSGVNAGERFSLGISEESIWLGLLLEILGASEYKPDRARNSGLAPQVGKARGSDRPICDPGHFLPRVAPLEEDELV
jgi:hypothetical protein